MPDPNPYLPPIEPAGTSPSRMTTLMVAWPVVLGVNLITPLLFGAELLGQQGWGGVIIAILMFLLVGWWLCLRSPKVARRLVAGASVVALSQFLPMLQFIAGVIALGIAEELGQVATGDEDNGAAEMMTGLGGWIITMGTGCILAVVSMVIGTLIFLTTGLEKEVPAQPAKNP